MANYNEERYVLKDRLYRLEAVMRDLRNDWFLDFHPRMQPTMLLTWRISKALLRASVFIDHYLGAVWAFFDRT